MPELPEVEAARRGIAEQLQCKPVTSIDLRLPKLLIAPDGLSLSNLTGQSIEATERRGKYLALTFPELVAIIHLKLAGQIVARGDDIPGFAAGHPVPAFDSELPHKSTHLIVGFDDGSQLYVTDIRHFTRIQLMDRDDLDAYWGKLGLGPDLLSDAFTLDYLHEKIARRSRSKIKPLLLDQKFLAGLGNIYVDESLYRARIHPERLASSLSDEEIERLYAAINEVIEIAVPLGGAKIVHSKAIPPLGEFPFVHGREGEPCPVCGNVIVKTRVNNRGTYLCPTCQPAP